MIVCYEDTIGDVREKYLRYNDNACRYEWRKDLSMVRVPRRPQYPMQPM